jgi:hypothetical protein
MGLNHNSSDLRGVGCVITIKIRFSKEKGGKSREHHVFRRHRPSRHESCITSLWHKNFPPARAIRQPSHCYIQVINLFSLAPAWVRSDLRSHVDLWFVKYACVPCCPFPQILRHLTTPLKAEHILIMTSYPRIQMRHYFMGLFKFYGSLQ